MGGGTQDEKGSAEAWYGALGRKHTRVGRHKRAATPLLAHADPGEKCGRLDDHRARRYQGFVRWVPIVLEHKKHCIESKTLLAAGPVVIYGNMSKCAIYIGKQCLRGGSPWLRIVTSRDDLQCFEEVLSSTLRKYMGPGVSGSLSNI